jgi:hypothetical protein
MRSGRASGRFAVVCTALVAVGALAGVASGHQTTAAGGPSGIVPALNASMKGKVSAVCTPLLGGAPCSPLRYHGGEVMHTTTTYTIFWKPNGYISGDGLQPYDANYIGLINQYFQDLATASGALSNVYGVATQYCDAAAINATSCTGVPGVNHITTQQTFGGTFTDTATAFPTNGCSPTNGAVKCLSDDQLQTEIQHAMSVNGWTGGPTKMFFIFTPEGVQSCFPGACAYTAFCAYHSSINYPSAGEIIYGNQPYPYVTTVPANQGCTLSIGLFGGAQRPNNSDADEQLIVTSHEHNEAITDPGGGDGWFDNADGSGGENGDKCAWFFGTPQGVNGSKFNQTINGHNYYLQLEWSNQDNDCKQAFSQTTGPAPIVTKLKPKAGVVGQPVTVSGKNLTGATAAKINGTAMTNLAVLSATKLTARVAPGTTTGNLVVTTPGGDSTGVMFTVNPSPLPVVKTVPKTASVGNVVLIKGKNFWGASAVTIHGTACTGVSVSSATKLTCTVGAGTTTGTVAVTTPGGTGTSTKSVTIV